MSLPEREPKPFTSRLQKHKSNPNPNSSPNPNANINRRTLISHRMLRSRQSARPQLYASATLKSHPSTSCHLLVSCKYPIHNSAYAYMAITPPAYSTQYITQLGPSLCPDLPLPTCLAVRLSSLTHMRVLGVGEVWLPFTVSITWLIMPGCEFHH